MKYTIEIERWVKGNLTAGRTVVSGGQVSFSCVQKADCTHVSIVTGGGSEYVTLEGFTWVNTMIINVKNALVGTYHFVSKNHLPLYLTEFCYRFNRRFQLEDMMPQLGDVVIRTSVMPVKLLKMSEAYG